MGRWIAKNLIDKGEKVWIIDNLSNGSIKNIEEFRGELADFLKMDILDRKSLAKLFRLDFDICIHLAASINVQASIDNPQECFNNNVIGTFNVLEECRRHKTKMVFMSSALVYQTAKRGQEITEIHPLNPSCVYTASKIFGENQVMAYYKTYRLPAVILRPFSIYGPWQRRDTEGGVMSIFIDKMLRNEPINVFGNGSQSRDFFYIEDCAEFIARAAFSNKAAGEIFNAGSGEEAKIKDLARKISAGKVAIKFVKHPHQHAEIMHMCADSAKARRLLGWKAKTSLGEGIEKTMAWLKRGQV